MSAFEKRLTEYLDLEINHLNRVIDELNAKLNTLKETKRIATTIKKDEEAIEKGKI